MIQIRDFTFNNPYAALLILAFVPLLLFQIYLYYYRKKKILSFSDSTLHSSLLFGRSKFLTIMKMMGWCLVWILTCLALMYPIGNLRYRHLATDHPLEETTVLKYKPHEVIFLVDTSASMSVPDDPSSQPRLDQAKEIMENIIRQLKGPTVSLYSMTSILTPIVPPTLDYLFIRLMIKSLHYDEGDIGGTLYKPVLTDLFKKDFSNTNKIYSLIILSDGGDNELETLQGLAKDKAMGEIVKTIPNGQDIHLRVFTVGIGSTTPHEIPHVTNDGKPVKSALEPKLLELLASKGRGAYFEAQTEIPWNLAQKVVEKINQDPPFIPNTFSTARKVVIANPEDLIYDIYFQIPLGLAILLLLALLIFPDIRRL